MSYIRAKLINGRSYLYLVESRREGGRVIQKHLKYLGRGTKADIQDKYQELGITPSREVKYEQDHNLSNPELMGGYKNGEIGNTTFKKGDKVEIEGEKGVTYTVLEATDEKGPMPRLLVEADIDFGIKPTKRIDRNEIEKIDTTDINPNVLALRKHEYKEYSTTHLNNLLEDQAEYGGKDKALNIQAIKEVLASREVDKIAKAEGLSIEALTDKEIARVIDKAYPNEDEATRKAIAKGIISDLRANEKEVKPMSDKDFKDLIQKVDKEDKAKKLGTTKIDKKKRLANFKKDYNLNSTQELKEMSEPGHFDHMDKNHSPELHAKAVKEVLAERQKKEASRKKARKEKPRTFTMEFREVEHDGDLQEVLQDIKRSGGKVDTYKVDEDREIGTVTFELDKKGAKKFMETESYEMRN